MQARPPRPGRLQGSVANASLSASPALRIKLRELLVDEGEHVVVEGHALVCVAFGAHRAQRRRGEGRRVADALAPSRPGEVRGVGKEGGKGGRDAATPPLKLTVSRRKKGRIKGKRKKGEVREGGEGRGEIGGRGGGGGAPHQQRNNNLEL